MTTSHDDRLRIDPDGRGIWLGRRHVPLARVLMLNHADLDGTGYSFRSRQAMVPFENGLQLSILWGSCSYSDNYEHSLRRPQFTDEPAKVEIALIGKHGDRLDFPDGNNVMPYVPMETVAVLMDRFAALPSEATQASVGRP